MRTRRVSPRRENAPADSCRPPPPIRQVMAERCPHIRIPMQINAVSKTVRSPFFGQTGPAAGTEASAGCRLAGIRPPRFPHTAASLPPWPPVTSCWSSAVMRINSSKTGPTQASLNSATQASSVPRIPRDTFTADRLKSSSRAAPAVTLCPKGSTAPRESRRAQAPDR